MGTIIEGQPTLFSDADDPVFEEHQKEDWPVVEIPDHGPPSDEFIELQAKFAAMEQENPEELSHAINADSRVFKLPKHEYQALVARFIKSAETDNQPVSTDDYTEYNEIFDKFDTNGQSVENVIRMSVEAAKRRGISIPPEHQS